MPSCGFIAQVVSAVVAAFVAVYLGPQVCHTFFFLTSPLWPPFNASISPEFYGAHCSLAVGCWFCAEMRSFNMCYSWRLFVVWSWTI